VPNCKESAYLVCGWAVMPRYDLGSPLPAGKFFGPPSLGEITDAIVSPVGSETLAGMQRGNSISLSVTGYRTRNSLR
jgi:hypothetical protein